jgi:hypothetical protein
MNSYERGGARRMRKNLITDAEAEEFTSICDHILKETRMPASWLARLLGYKMSSGLSMALKDKPSRAAYENALKLKVGLRSWQGQQRERNGT